MSVQMHAIKTLVYAGRRLQVGEVFTVRSNRDAKVLKAIGKAELCKEPVQDAPKVALPVHIVPTVEDAPSIAANIEGEPATAVGGEDTAGDVDVAQESAVANEQQDNGLESMDFEALHALAAELGVNVHHRAGAQKVRQAIRDFKAAK